MTHKKKWISFIFEVLLIIFLFFSSGPSRYPQIFYQLEQIRFQILRNQYQKTVEQLVDNLGENEQLSRVEINNFLLSSGNEVHYKKEGNSVLILFTTEYRDISGYAWYSDDVAYNWLKSDCYFMKTLDDSWIMMQVYP